MHQIGERTSVPLVWLVSVVFIGGSVLVAISMRWSSLEAKANSSEGRIETVEIRQDKYNSDIHAIKESIVRIEQKIEDSKHRR